MKKFIICFFMLAGTLFLQAQVRRTPVQRTQVQQTPSVVVKEGEPLLVNGWLAFMGIPVKQPKTNIIAKLKEKGFVLKDDYGNIRWEGTAYGTKGSLAIIEDYNEQPEGISYREIKNYSKTQARNRVIAYQKTFLEATGGRIIENTMANNGIEGEYVKIEAGKGVIEIQYANEDEVNFESPYYNVIVQFRDPLSDSFPNDNPVTRAITDGQAFASSSSTINIAQTNDEVYEIAEKNPSFPGGEQELNKYLASKMIYPKAAQEVGEQGRVIIQFVVNADGSLSDIRVSRSVSPALDAEALRIVQQMPRWIPGQKNGKNVRVRFSLPIIFRLR